MSNNNTRRRAAKKNGRPHQTRRPSFSPLPKCVEPVKRMVGGRYGWAVHRFPIKGGVTVARIWSEDLTAAMNKPSYLFTHMLAAKDGPIQAAQQETA